MGQSFREEDVLASHVPNRGDGRRSLLWDVARRP